jgi:plastocyanin
MTTKVLYALIALLILIGTGFYIYDARQRQAVAPTQTADDQAQDTATAPDNQTPANTNDTSTNNTSGQTNQNQTNQNQTRFSDETDVNAGADVMVHEIAFNGTAFSPATLSIKQGDIVIFRNNSNKAFSPASAPHPAHTDYPEFDPKRQIAAGGSYQFKFEKVGSWRFHDHLTPSAFGTITVTR